MLLRPGPERVRWTALWGDGPAAGVGALFDVGPGTGAAFPGFGFESGESNELMSMMAEVEDGETCGTSESRQRKSDQHSKKKVKDQRPRIVLRVAEIQIRQQPRGVSAPCSFLHRQTQLDVQIPARGAGGRNRERCFSLSAGAMRVAQGMMYLITQVFRRDR